MALMLISHDLGVIAQNVARMLVMYGGSVVESGPTAAVFATGLHPYSLGLFAARPGLRSKRPAAGHHPGHRAGTGGSSIRLPVRGPLWFTIRRCSAVPPPFEVEPGHQARCIRLDAGGAEGAEMSARNPGRLPQREEGKPQ